MNSKYAPVVALTALVILIVAALGIFLGIKPLLDDAAKFDKRETVVRDNTSVIKASSADIDAKRKALSAAPDLTEAIELNAPAEPLYTEFEDRLIAAIRASSMEVVSVSIETPNDIIAWTVPAEVRPSSTVATLFETGPTPRLSGEGGDGTVYAPVVTQAAEDTTAGANIVRVNVLIKVKGTAAEMQSFLTVLADENQRIFQVNDLQVEGRYVRDSPDAGVSLYADGDVVGTVIGSLYLLNPTGEIEDEEELIPWTLPGDRSPFTEPANADPQPGAN